VTRKLKHDIGPNCVLAEVAFHFHVRNICPQTVPTWKVVMTIDSPDHRKLVERKKVMVLPQAVHFIEHGVLFPGRFRGAGNWDYADQEAPSPNQFSLRHGRDGQEWDH
jgi:hypothetical protein